MALIDSGLLSFLRETTESFLSDSCVRTRVGEQTSDGAGGWTDGEETTETYACRVQVNNSQGKEGVVADQKRAKLPYEVVLPHDADVVSSDTLTVNGMTLEVTAPADGQSDSLTKVVLCKRVM